tara:strand:- start:159 stop:2573 length:2415 start_codon:yes stop_codon:yes gene_type:complete
MKIFFNTLAILIGTIFFTSLLFIAGLVWLFWSYGQNLPDYSQLSKYEPPVVSRVYASDGALLDEFATEKRLFVPIQSIPSIVKEAFLSSEDKDFYNHLGLDFKAIIRASLTNLQNYNSGKRAIGASTITQQIAKNFLLSSDYSFERKIKEAILALRIERTFSKDHIFELYLNEIYLGLNSYGVAAAALNYFDKPLSQISLEEAAYLAALPKGPNNYHPIKKTKQAKIRRNWVLSQMYKNGLITENELQRASLLELKIASSSGVDDAYAPYPVEEIRKTLIKSFGHNSLYTGGLSIQSTIDPKIQKLADRSLKIGIESLDRRQGWRGPLTKKMKDESDKDALKRASLLLPDNYKVAIVNSVSPKKAEITTNEGFQGYIPLQNAMWARKKIDNKNLGKAPNDISQIINVGDIIPILKPISEDMEIHEKSWMLSQKPKVSGAILVIDPHTGRILAMSGGYSFSDSEFNRSTQALRQPGSAFKPFIYLSALEKNYLPTTLIRDAPIVIDQGPGLPKWKPSNYSNKFYGPSTLRTGVEKSRNLMTARLALELGMESVQEIAKRFGINNEMPNLLSMSLGAGETSLINLVNAYAMIVNGGKQIYPTLIDRIQDRRGNTIFLFDKRDCNNCKPTSGWQGQSPPEIIDNRKSVTDPYSAYQMTSILKGVIDRGTGIKLKKLNLNLAGKTGTTNDNTNAWFIGFSPDIVVGVYIGYDEPSPLGKRETGSSAAVPIFEDFFKNYSKNKPDIPFRRPDGIRLIPIHVKSGIRANEIKSGVIQEAFKKGQFPKNDFLQNEDNNRTINSENLELGIY